MNSNILLIITVLLSFLLNACGSDNSSSDPVKDNDEIIIDPAPIEPPPTDPPQNPDPSTPAVEDISQQFQTAIADNLYLFKYLDSTGKIYVAMVPKMARLAGDGLFKVANEQLAAIQIVDDYQLSRPFNELTLPFLKPTTSDDISLIIAQTLNIDISHVYAISKSGGALYLPTEDQGYNNSYEYHVNGQICVLRLNASDYPVDTKIPFPGELQGMQRIELDYQIAPTPYFSINIRLFADTTFIHDVTANIYLKGTLNQVEGTNDLYRLDASW